MDSTALDRNAAPALPPRHPESVADAGRLGGRPNPGSRSAMPNGGRMQAPRREARRGRLADAALRAETPATRRALRADVERLAPHVSSPRPPHRDPTEHDSPNRRLDADRAQEALRWLGAAMQASGGRAELVAERDALATTFRLRQPLDPHSVDDTLALRAACLAGERALAASELRATRDEVEVMIRLPSDGDAPNPGRRGWPAP